MIHYDSLKGRVALISGGGGEIGGRGGRGCGGGAAGAAVGEGRRRAADEVAQANKAAGGRALALTADVSIANDAQQSVAETVAAFEKLTTLVNVAAAVTPDGTVETL